MSYIPKVKFGVVCITPSQRRVTIVSIYITRGHHIKLLKKSFGLLWGTFLTRIVRVELLLCENCDFGQALPSCEAKDGTDLSSKSGHSWHTLIAATSNFWTSPVRVFQGTNLWIAYLFDCLAFSSLYMYSFGDSGEQLAMVQLRVLWKKTKLFLRNHFLTSLIARWDIS